MAADHLVLGRKGERIACRFLMRRGFDILARRYRKGHGELDIVAFEGQILSFIEVKTRRSNRYGKPWEFVDWKKQHKMRRTAEFFIADNDLCEYVYRFDIISVVLSKGSRVEVELFRNAF